MPYLTLPLGNNSISYNQRKGLGNKCKLFVPDTHTINSIDDVQLGSEIVFEEIDHQGQLQSLTGLAALYQMGKAWIMDNHNYALFAWAQHQRPQTADHRPIVIHIDAHADLDQPLRPKGSDEDRRTYTTTGVTVGSFIQPALKHNLISNCIQIRSSYALEHITLDENQTYILDIDLDFRADQNKIPIHHLTHIKKTLDYSQITCITIAVSPYFLDQYKAMKFLQQLKPILQSTA